MNSTINITKRTNVAVDLEDFEERELLEFISNKGYMIIPRDGTGRKVPRGPNSPDVMICIPVQNYGQISMLNDTLDALGMRYIEVSNTDIIDEIF